MSAALALFEERGIDGVSVMDVCKRASVNRTTFYKYFQNKDALLEEIMPGKFRGLVNTFVNSMGNTGSITERLIQALKPTLLAVENDPILSMYSLESFSASASPVLLQIRADFAGKIEAAAANMLKNSGSAPDAEASVAVCTAMIFGWVSQPKGVRRVSTERFCDAMTRILVNAHRTAMMEKAANDEAKDGSEAQPLVS